MITLSVLFKHEGVNTKEYLTVFPKVVKVAVTHAHTQTRTCYPPVLNLADNHTFFLSHFCTRTPFHLPDSMNTLVVAGTH